MSVDMVTNQDYEQILINTVRTLPPNRAEQLVDFARFLEAQILTEELLQDEAIAEIEADNAEWDALLATDESQILLEKLASEALAEHQAGKTKPMVFNNEGQLVTLLKKTAENAESAENCQRENPVNPRNPRLFSGNSLVPR